MVSIRTRLRFSKTGPIRFTSNLDDLRVWDRAIRRARLPIAFTQGFSPRPRLHFGPALPTCYESSSEYVDLDSTEPVDDIEVAARLTASLPDGMDVLIAREVDPKSPSLQAIIEATEYLIWLDTDDVDDVAGRLDVALRADTLIQTIRKKGRDVEVDIRPGIVSAHCVAAGHHLEAPRVLPFVFADRAERPAIWCRLTTKPRSTRPTELLAALGGAAIDHVVHRTALIVDSVDAGCEPIGSSTDTTVRAASPARDPAEIEEYRNGQICTKTQGFQTDAGRHADRVDAAGRRLE